jgi:hypothetical protein
MRDPHVHEPAGPGEYCTGCFDQGVVWSKYEERARIRQIIEREIGEWQSVIASHKSLPGHRGDVNVAIDSIEALTCLLAAIDEGGNDE